MNVLFEPSAAKGAAAAPPSKSMAHRLLVAAALCEDQSEIDAVSLSDDVAATIRCLRMIGVGIDVVGEACRVRGIDFRRAKPCGVLDCGECGSTLRFLLPLCMLSGEAFRLTGSSRLLSRPLGVYETLCRDRGIFFENNGNTITVQGTLTGGEYAVPGNISSQFITGLLFALPLLPTDSEIRLLDAVESRPYIDMTCSVLADAGIVVEQPDEHTMRIPGCQSYGALRKIVEGDWSNAAFLFALDAIGGDVAVKGLQNDSLQGDKVCISMFEQLKCGRPPLDISDCPDLGPVLMVVAAACKGAVLTGTRRLRLKESDRGVAMAEELEKFGVRTVIAENEIKVGAGLRAPTSAVCGHTDHRIAMALSVVLTRTGGLLTDAESVNKSWPAFFETMKELGVNCRNEA